IYRLIAQNTVKDAYLEIDPVLERNAKGHISLADGKVSGPIGEDGLSAQSIGVRTSPEVDPVPGSPFRFVQWLSYTEWDHIQIEAVSLAGAAKSEIRQAFVAGAEVPLGGCIHITTQSCGC